MRLSVNILLLLFNLFPLYAFSSNSCLQSYSNKSDRLKITISSKIKNLLTPTPTAEKLIEISKEIDEQIKDLEQSFGPYPKEQREVLAKSMRLDSFYPKYNLLYHRAKNSTSSDQASFAVTFNSYSLESDSSMVRAFEATRQNIVDHVFFKALAQNKYKNAVELNPEDIHTFILEQQNLDTEGRKQKSQATLRVIERNEGTLTIIEKYANRVGYKINEFLKLANENRQNHGSFFEMSRVANLIKNKKIMITMRYMIDQLLLKGSVNNLLAISVKDLSLVPYYEDWGFYPVEKMQGLDGNNSYIIMVTNGKIFRQKNIEKISNYSPAQE